MDPFWRDKPSQYDDTVLRTGRIIKIWGGMIRVYVGVVSIVIVAALFSTSKPLLFAWLVLCMLATLYGLHRRNRTKADAQAVSTIQERAYQRIGASMMGSVNHVAGHPSLHRDERVVLAVIGNSLRIYRFTTPNPLDEIPAEAIQKLELVVYDDERIPHTDAIDSAAQALQISFARGANTSRCLFNRMLEHRPIDWYHELEKLRLTVDP